MKILSTSIVFATLLGYQHATFAHNKVVVVPLGETANVLAKIKNVITVGQASADFTNPALAMTSITDASATNPYLIVIGPGTYTMGASLAIKPNVHVVGSGIDVTILEAGFGATTLAESAVVKTSGAGSSRSSIRDLTINQFGFGQQTSTGLYVGGPTVVENVTIEVRSFGATNYGIYSDQSTLTMNETRVLVRNATGFTAGTYLDGGSAFITETDISARDGTFVAALYNESSTVQVDRSNASASKLSGTNAAWGLYSRLNARTTVRYSGFRTLGGSNIGGGSCVALDTSYAFFGFSDVADGCVGAGVFQCIYTVSSQIPLLPDCSLQES